MNLCYPPLSGKELFYQTSRSEICHREGNPPWVQINSLADVGRGVPEEPLTLKTAGRLLR